MLYLVYSVIKEIHVTYGYFDVDGILPCPFWIQDSPRLEIHMDMPYRPYEYFIARSQGVYVCN